MCSAMDTIVMESWYPGGPRCHVLARASRRKGVAGRLLVMSLCGVVGGRARSDRAVLTPLLQQWSDIVVRKWLLS